MSSDDVVVREGHSERRFGVMHVLVGYSYGIASSVGECASKLKQLGVEVSIAVLTDGRLEHPLGRTRLEASGVTVHEIPLSSLRGWMRPRLLFRAPDLVRLARTLGHMEADVIQCHGPLALGAVLLERHRPPVVATFHGMTNSRSPTQRFYRATMALADSVVLYKAEDARAIRRWTKPERVYLAKNGVDVEWWQRDLCASRPLRSELGVSPETFLVGLVGRLSREKGFELLLTASARSGWLTAADAHLVIAGAGPRQARLESLAGRLGVAGRVHLLGYRPDMGNVYRTLDVLAFPSDTESQPMAVLEAMACRVPVAGFSVGALSEMLADGAGALIRPGDFNALLLALDSLRSSRGARAQLADRALKRVSEEYDSRGLAQRLLRDLYAPLAAARDRAAE